MRFGDSLPHGFVAARKIPASQLRIMCYKPLLGDGLAQQGIVADGGLGGHARHFLWIWRLFLTP